MAANGHKRPYEFSMEDGMKAVNLSSREFMYLTNTDFLPASLIQLIKSGASKDSETLAITVDRENAEKLRDAFSTRLAKVGFDKSYEPTAEGRMLEALIDRFFIP